jgi:predicted site-specific integrase-resolvase
MDASGWGMKQQLIGITKAARILGVHPNTLRKWADEGRVPHVLLPSGYRRFSIVAMERFRHQMERGPDAGAEEDERLGELAA